MLYSHFTEHAQTGKLTLAWLVCTAKKVMGKILCNDLQLAKYSRGRRKDQCNTKQIVLEGNEIGKLTWHGDRGHPFIRIIIFFLK